MAEERHKFEIERKELTEQIRELKKQTAQPQPTLTEPSESNEKAPTATPELITISPTPLPRPLHNYPPFGIDHESYLRPREATESIPKFNGHNIPLHQFINSCEDVASSLSAYPTPDVIKNIKRRLIGDAERLTYGMEFLTIDSFTQTIKTIFSQQKTFDEYRAELINLKQRPHENVTQYAARTLELRDSLLNSLRDQKPPKLDYSVAQEEASILEKFVKGLLQQIRIELRQAGYQTMAEAIGKAKTLEKELDITYNTKYPTDDRRQIVRNEIRTYQRYIGSNNDYDQIQNRRYDYGQPRLGNRDPDRRYNPNIENRNHSRNYNSNIDNGSFNRERSVNNYFDRQRNPPSHPFPEDRRGYYQRPEEYQNTREYRNQRDYRNTRDYRSPRAGEYPNQRDHINQRVGNYKDDRNFDAYRNPNFPNTYAPPAAYEPERPAPRTNDPRRERESHRLSNQNQIGVNYLAGIPRVVKARIKPNTPVTLLIDTGSQLNLIKEHLLTPGTTITEPYNLPLQGIGEGTVRTLGTVTLEIFSRTALFHIVPRSMPTPGDGILGDEFFMNTGVTIDYIKQHIHFQDIYVPFYDGESVVIGAKETRQIEIMILNSEVKEGILNRHESMPGLYIEKTIVRHEEGRVVVKVVNETDKEIVIKVPTLAISPLEEGVTPVVRNLEDGKATSGVDSRTKILTMEDNLSDNVEIEESVLTRPVGKATSDVDSREEEVMIDRISNTTSVVGEQVTINLGKLDRRRIGKVMEESENKNVLISGKNREEELKLIEKEIRKMKLNNEVKKICENHVGNKEINDDRSNVGKELGKIELYCEERNKEVSGMEAEKLEDGKAASGVDSHTNETAPGKKPLVIVTCEGLATKKNNEDSFRKVEIEIFNEGYNDTIIDLMNTYENLWEKELEIDEEKGKSLIEACRELGNIESDEVHEKLTDIKRTATRLDKGNSDTICELDNAASVVDTRVNQHSGGINQIEIGKEAERKDDSEIAIGDNILEPNTKMNYLSFCNLSTETAVRVGFDHNPDNIKTVNQVYSNRAISEVQPTRKNLLLSLLRLDNLGEEEKYCVGKIAEKYSEHFHLPGDPLGATNVTKHRIQTIDDTPINVKQYRFPLIHKEEIKKQIREMIDSGIIETSTSPYNSPLWIVPKKPDSQGNKRWRLVIDFRGLNEKTVSDAFSLPNITDILDQLGNAKYFTTLDLASGFHQIEMHPDDAHKTGFSTPFGHYQFKRMPFGLKNAPATFQRTMNEILHGLQGESLFVYLDDIVIYSKDLTDHMYKFDLLMERIKTANLKLQPDKCEFLQKQVKYLGHVIGSNGVQPDPDKLSAVRKFPTPKTPKNIKQFLGLAGYYRP
ncbi:hypothetical protein M0802_017030 [Mischocyttarus mexicanus]|nr:hypothetical protein M0802_017030 [Mischocyttarus mexicanus]